MNDAQTPVIVGTGQLVDRDANIDRYIEPLEMLTRTAILAAEDAGVGSSLLEKLDTVALVGVSGWHPQNAPGLVGERLGAHPAKEYTTAIGGQVGVTLTNFAADQIMAGKSDLALVSGCNNLRVLMKAVAAKRQMPWTRGGQGDAELIFGDEKGTTELEISYGMAGPPDVYPLFENALRARLGLDMGSHQKRMGRLFERFTEVAAGNPYAWFPIRRSAEELTTVTPNNRMISFPYTKYLNAILNTEQAASLIVTSVAKARSLGIPEDRWVYWWGGAHSQEKAWWVSERPDFASCPAMKDSTISALTNAGVDISEIDHMDFYSCFPVAVEMACQMLGLDVNDGRGFTVTGGLPYAGGPASAYTLHSLSSMVEKLRANPGTGLVTGNGWYLTKHAAAVLASEPKGGHRPRTGLVDSLPSEHMETAPQPLASRPQGPAHIEAYTVHYGRDGKPVRGVVLGRTAEGERFLANTPNDTSLLEAFVSEERIGSRGTLVQPSRQDEQDGLTLFEPA
jgi:acetyl-CoA C-acetyltransferase